MASLIHSKGSSARVFGTSKGKRGLHVREMSSSQRKRLHQRFSFGVKSSRIVNPVAGLFLDEELLKKAEGFLLAHARVERKSVIIIDEDFKFGPTPSGVAERPKRLGCTAEPENELKDVKLSDEIIRTARGLFSSTKTYRFRMHSVSAISSDSSGNLKGTFSCDPATTTFSEWSTLILLFDEAKLLATSFHWVAFMSTSGVNEATNGTTSTTPHYSAGAAVAIGFRPDQIATTPSSITAVFRLPAFKLFNIYQPHIKAVVRKLPSRTWSEVTTPSPLHPIGGMAGCWEYMAATTVNNSVQYCTQFLSVDVAFRSRI